MTVATRIDRFDIARHDTAVDTWLIRRLLAGWTPQAVAIASAGRVSVRTAYRWRAAVLGVEAVRVGGYVADFALRRDRPPIRISAWRAAVL